MTTSVVMAVPSLCVLGPMVICCAIAALLAVWLHTSGRRRVVASVVVVVLVVGLLGFPIGDSCEVCREMASWWTCCLLNVACCFSD